MANIIISELRPDESFLTELESDVLTASIVGGDRKRGRGKRKKINVNFARKFFRFPKVNNKFKSKKGKVKLNVFIDTFNNFGQVFFGA